MAAIETDAGRFDDDVDLSEHIGDSLRAKDTGDIAAIFLRDGHFGCVIQQHQRQPRMMLSQKPDCRAPFAAQPPDCDASRAEISHTHQAWPCRNPEPGEDA